MRKVYPLIFILFMILTGCTTIEPLNTPEVGYYWFLGEESEISEVSGLIGSLDPVMEGRHMVKSGFGDAEQILQLSAGRRMVPERGSLFYPKYDTKTRTTYWLHEKAPTREALYISVTAIHADDYRIGGVETQMWKMQWELPFQMNTLQYRTADLIQLLAPYMLEEEILFSEEQYVQ